MGHMVNMDLITSSDSVRAVLRRDAGKCAYCGGDATTVDRIQPDSGVGSDNWNNLVAMCDECAPAPTTGATDEGGMKLVSHHRGAVV